MLEYLYQRPPRRVAAVVALRAACARGRYRRIALQASSTWLRENALVCTHMRRAGRHRRSMHRLYVLGGRAGEKIRCRPRLYFAPANFDDAQAEVISVGRHNTLTKTQKHVYTQPTT